MNIRQFNRIIDIVTNNGIVIADRYHETYIDKLEITDETNMLTLINLDSKELSGYHFYIKDNDKPICELEEIL